VSDLQECEHGAVRFEALQTASRLAGAAPPMPVLWRGEPTDGAPPGARSTALPSESAPTPPSLPEGVEEVPEREGNLHVPAPNMYLVDNLDEPNNWGYCMDITGPVPFTGCPLVQGHSCKEEGADGQFEYDAELQAVRSTNFDGTCQALYSGTGHGVSFTAVAGEKGCLQARSELLGSPFAVAPCDGNPMQKFTYTPSRQLAVGNGSLCMALGVDVTTVGQGPMYMVKRDVQLQDCASWDPSLSTWEILLDGHTRYQPA